MKSLPPGFRLNRKKFVPQEQATIVRRAIELLKKLSFGELIDTRQLAAALGASIHHVHQFVADPGLADFRRRATHESRRILVWGSPATIKKFDKDMQ